MTSQPASAPRARIRALAGFVPDCAILFSRLLRDKRVPRRSRVLVALLIPYLALPFDLVPDFIPVVGQLDDALLVAIVLRHVVRRTDPELLREHWPGPASSLAVVLRLAEADPARSRRRALATLAVAAQALVFGPLVVFRFVDGDEGVYAYASRLAIHGHVPYRDFFYEQMPLLPYVYGAWIGVLGESWYTIRSLSALLGIAVGALLYLHVARRRGLWPALAALALYVLSGLVFGYFGIVKTFALASLFLLGAFISVEGRERPRWLAAGLLLGLAVDTRLVFAAAILAFAGLAAGRRGLARFACGLVVGLVPSLVLLALSPHAFVFDNLRYHGEKTSHGLVGDPGQKVRTAANLVGFGNADHALGLQFALLLVGSAAALWLLRRRLPFAAAVGVSLGVASFLPTPTYVQYFCVVVPYLVLTVVELTEWRRGTIALAAGLAAYAVAAGFAFAHDVQTSALLKPSVRSVARVSDTVQIRTQPDEEVLSGWPGYLFGTHARAVSGYTNQFAPAAAAKVSPDEAARVHVLSETEIERLIRARVPRLVVERNWVTSPPFAHWDAALRAGGYRLVATVETAKIYER